MQQRILPGRGNGARSPTEASGGASPSAASRSNAGCNRSNRSISFCIVSCGVWPGSTVSARLTTPRPLSKPGMGSACSAVWNSTSFMTPRSPRCSICQVGPRLAEMPYDRGELAGLGRHLATLLPENAHRVADLPLGMRRRQKKPQTRGALRHRRVEDRLNIDASPEHRLRKATGPDGTAGYNRYD